MQTPKNPGQTIPLNPPLRRGTFLSRHPDANLFQAEIRTVYSPEGCKPRKIPARQSPLNPPLRREGPPSKVRQTKARRALEYWRPSLLAAYGRVCKSDPPPNPRLRQGKGRRCDSDLNCGVSPVRKAPTAVVRGPRPRIQIYPPLNPLRGGDFMGKPFPENGKSKFSDRRYPLIFHFQFSILHFKKKGRSEERAAFYISTGPVTSSAGNAASTTGEPAHHRLSIPSRPAGSTRQTNPQLPARPLRRELHPRATARHKRDT